MENTSNAKRQTPNAKRQTPNAKPQTPNLKRREHFNSIKIKIKNNVHIYRKMLQNSCYYSTN